MRLSLTLSFYIARVFAFWFVAVFLAFLATAFLLDTIELLRRAAAKPDATMDIILRMAALKLPHLAEELTPFIILFSSMLTFWRLTRTHELIVVRAAGVSVWQFLLPVLALTLLIGIVKTLVVNPVAAAFYAGFEQLDGRYLRGRSSSFAVSPTGLWLREADGQGNSVVHALRIASQEMELFDVIIFQFAGKDRFIGRIDARTARLEPGAWQLTDAWITAPDKPAVFLKDYRLETTMTLERIQDSFASPSTISFWELPQFIQMLETAGFSAIRHRMYWHSLQALPLLLLAMVLIAATFSMRPARRGGAAALAVVGIGAGFVLFFVSNLVGALGQSASIPIILAAWSPAGVSTLLGVSMLLHLEDG